MYGMGGDDIFEVSGETKSPITVRMIGGDGKDRFEINEELSHKSNTYIYDRSDQENEMPSSNLAKLRLSTQIQQLINTTKRALYLISSARYST
ncbi:hypothetical protein [Pedobacter sp. NJ-S-72]